MQKFFDAIKLALSAIWAGKLRSFMTVLGNIVAVTSIIAVVSLIRGMNNYVSDAILSDVWGAGEASEIRLARRYVSTIWTPGGARSASRSLCWMICR